MSWEVCATCGHMHLTMASSWTKTRGTRFYCHENDHSCYEEYTRNRVLGA